MEPRFKIEKISAFGTARSARQRLTYWATVASSFVQPKLLIQESSNPAVLKILKKNGLAGNAKIIFNES